MKTDGEAMTAADYIASLLSPEQAKMDWKKLREEAEGVLCPKPWKHKRATSIEEGWGVKEWNYCAKCHKGLDGDCHVPGPATRFIEVIAEKLLRLIDAANSLPLLERVMSLVPQTPKNELCNCYERFMFAEPQVRAACCLAALRNSPENLRNLVDTLE